MPKARTADALIMEAVISAVGVRSWNAPETASSNRDMKNKTWNRSTLSGTVIVTGNSLHQKFLGKLQPHLPVAVGIVAPILAHFDEQEQVHRHAQYVRDLLARFGTDRLDGRAALAEHDLALPFPLDKDGLLDAHGFVLPLGP